MRRAAWVKQLGDDAGPTRLMRCAEAASVIAVEKFVEEDVVAEMRIAREFGVRFHRGSLTVRAFEKEFGEATGDFIRRVVERD